MKRPQANPMIPEVIEFLDFVDQSPSQVDPQAWAKAAHLGDALVGSCGHDVAVAVQALRDYAHPGRPVGERDYETMEAFLDLGVLPRDLYDLKRDRAYNGVPSYFPTPPSRQGADRIQPSLADHLEEAINSLWDEFKAHKLILVTAPYREQHLAHLPNSPLARVPKQDARGRTLPTGRIIRNHSFPKGKSINDLATLPPPGDIKLPTIQVLVGDFLFWRSIFPNLRLVFAKCDVSSAFPWLGLSAKAVPFMGSYMVGGKEFIAVFCLPTRLTFGFIHSPVEWDIESKALGTYIAAVRFSNPRRDGAWEPTSREYVDDIMLMSPDIGWRPELTMLAAENTIKGLLGPSAINLKKHAVEGKWSTTAIFLGFEFDSVAGTISLSVEKLEKARNLLASKKFDKGSKDLTKHDLQVLQGSLHHWSQACRPIQGFTSGLLRILSSLETEFQIDPSWRSPETKEWAWERFWEDITCLRMILADVSLVSSPLKAPYLVALSPTTRMSLARSEDRFVVLGTDATEWSVAAVDYHSEEGTRIQLPNSVPQAIREATLKQGLRRGISKKGETLCMAVTELLSVILGLLQWGDSYQSSLVIVVTDNHSVLSWLRSRCAKNVYAQALLRLMIRMEVRGRYEVWAEDIRSEDNHLPDALSRLQDRSGREDRVERQRWEHYSQLRKKIFAIKEPLHPFPSSWFSTPGNRNWTLLLPGESEAQFNLWNSSPTASQTPLTVPGVPPAVGTFGTTPLSPQSRASLQRRLESAKDHLKTNALASTTRAKYGAAFRVWTEFRHLLGCEPYLSGDHRENTEAVLDFIAYQGVLRALKHGTVQGYLTALRHYHLDAGLGDVSKHPKITAAMTGLKKLSGASVQKRPVTPQMLIHIYERLRSTGQVLHSFLIGGVQGPYFFMLRASEYAASSPGVWDQDKILRRKDIKWKLLGKYTHKFWRADEVEIHIRSSKTDQVGVGAFRSMKCSGETLCVVKTFQQVYELGADMEDTAPFLMTPSGLMITRGMVSDILKSAAKDLGDPLDEYSSHSLRRGGATALYSKGYSRESIMYLGRWRSDTWLRYAKMTQEQLTSAGKDLATASYTLAGGNTAYEPNRHSGPQGALSNPDENMLAWSDPDPEDPGIFVLLGIQLDPDLDRRTAYYIRVEVWDREKHRLPMDLPSRIRELSVNHTVLFSDPCEVEGWIAANPVELQVGGI